jgi:hypothetical protein
LFMMTTNSEMVGDDRATWILLCTGLMATLATDLTALYWVGLWKALTAKNPNRAAIANFILILILPSIALALIWLVVLLATMSGAHEPTLRFFLGLWFGLGVAADLFFAAWARHKLLSGFRLAAAERYAPRTGLLKKLFPGPSSTAKLPRVVAEQR